MWAKKMVCCGIVLLSLASLLLVFFPPGYALISEIADPPSGTYAKGAPITFRYFFSTEGAEIMPLGTNLAVVLTGPTSGTRQFYTSGNPYSGPSWIGVSDLMESHWSATGSLHGYDHRYNYDYSFGSGTGYRHNSSYLVTIDSNYLSLGSYSVYCRVDTGNPIHQYYNSLTASFSVTANSLTTRTPIRINNNAEFDAGHGVSTGDGSQGNPFVIQNYQIDGTGYGYCVYVGNTTSYFEIRGCNLYGASGNSGLWYRNCAIYFNNTQNGTISKNNISSNANSGLGFVISRNNVIKNNSVYMNTANGVALESSWNNSLYNNNVTINNIGIYFYYLDARNNTIHQNKVTANDYGIYLYQSCGNIFTQNNAGDNYRPISLFSASNQNTIRNNSVSNGSVTALYIESSNSNTIINNTFSNTTYLYSPSAIYLYSSSSNVIINNTISNCNSTESGSVTGIYLYSSTSNTVQGNVITNNNASLYFYGIYLYISATNNVIMNNTISNNNGGFTSGYGYGIYIYSSNSNSIINNSVSKTRGYTNGYGFYITTSNYNTLYHNNISNNMVQAYDSGTNWWNDSYPSGGNYWSDYAGADNFHGANQDVPLGDGIGDTPRSVTGGSNQDKYPLMTPWTPAPQTPSFSIPVVAGWNLVSMPLIPASSALPGALADLDGDTIWERAQWYDPFNPSNVWRQYYNGWAPSLNDLTDANHTMGVWIYVATVGDGFIRVGGSVAPSTSIPLRAGWNLVGYPTLNATTSVGDAFWGTGADMVETFDPAATYRTKVVASSYVMKPGEGYWVHVPADTVWTVDW